LEKWNKKLSNVQDKPEKEEGGEGGKEPKQEEPTGGTEEEQAEMDPSQMYEHVEEDEKADAQTLAAANEEQLKEFQEKTEESGEPKPDEKNAGAKNSDGKEMPKEFEEADNMDLDQEEEEEDEEEGQKLNSERPEELQNPEQKVLDEKKRRQPTSSKVAKKKEKENAMDLDDFQGEGESGEGQREKKGNLIGEGMAENQPQDQDRDDQMEGLEEQKQPKDHDQLRAELEATLQNWKLEEQNRDNKAAMELWHKVENVTRDLALELTESLRLILEPTLATKLKGDYRTGKRLNMKKIIPYIASQFKKDKIWLRRTKPSKRQYQVMIAVDDSRSMSDSKSVQMAYETVAMISTALSQLEVGDISVVSFGKDVSLLHRFGDSFNSEAGASILSRFTFNQEKTYFGNLVEKSISLMESARASAAGGGAGKIWQLEIIISDGIILDDDRRNIRRLIRAAAEKRIFVVYIAIDNREKSIIDLQSANYQDNKLVITRYLDTFPFDYYLVLRDTSLLPDVLADALRQWFEMIKSISD